MQTMQYRKRNTIVFLILLFLANIICIIYFSLYWYQKKFTNSIYYFSYFMSINLLLK